MSTRTESLYFRDINRYRILTEDEEREIILSVQKNDNGAISILITSNLRFVVSVARRYRGRASASWSSSMKAISACSKPQNASTLKIR